MADRPAKLAAGHYVLGIAERETVWVSVRSYPVVRFWLHGHEVRHLTPSEARALAANLLDEADHAEKGGYRG